MARLLPSANGGGRIVTAGQPEQDLRFPGEIAAIATNLTGAYSPPATGVVQNGWMLCDGAAIPGSNVLSGTTPNTSDERFLVGSTAAGSTGGSNTQVDHTHGFSLTAAGQGGGSVAITSSGGGTTGGESGHTHSPVNIAFGNNTSGTSDGIADSYRPSNNGGVFSVGGSTGGSSGHTHTTPNHTHTVPNHTHSSSSVTGSVGSGSVATSTNSRPQYVSVVYMIKVS